LVEYVGQFVDIPNDGGIRNTLHECPVFSRAIASDADSKESEKATELDTTADAVKPRY
jgi:hypothetical protein